MKYIKSVNEYKRSTEDMKRYVFEGSQQKDGNVKWVSFHWFDIENKSAENSMRMQNMFKDGKIIPEVKKEILKYKVPMLIKVLEWAIKNLSKENLNIFNSFDYTVYNKPIIIYKRGGKAIKLPKEYVYIYSAFTDHKTVLFYSDLDSKPYIDELNMRTDSIAAHAKEGFYDKFINGSTLLKMLIYAEYDTERKSGPPANKKLDRLGELYMNNYKTLDNMHNKKWMEEFDMMDGLQKDFGFFDD